MKFVPMDKETREKLVACEKDELSAHAKNLRSIPECPKCGGEMRAQRPSAFGVGTLALHDWRCATCGVVVTGASDLIVGQ